MKIFRITLLIGSAILLAIPTIFMNRGSDGIQMIEKANADSISGAGGTSGGCGGGAAGNGPSGTGGCACSGACCSAGP